MKNSRNEALKICQQTLTIIWRDPAPPAIDGEFYNWCVKNHKPYVRVRRRRASADILMDLPTASGLLDEPGFIQFRNLCIDLGFPATAHICLNPAMTGVPIGKADMFAKGLVEIGTAFCRRHPQ